MIPYKTSIPPEGDEDFEELCLIAYRETYRDFSACRVGRSGQAQGGIDILAREGERRVGIQCKRVKYSKLTESVINKEVEKADAAPRCQQIHQPKRDRMSGQQGQVHPPT